MYIIESRKNKYYVVNSENSYEEYDFTDKQKAEELQERLNLQISDLKKEKKKKEALKYELNRSDAIAKSLRERISQFLKTL